MTTKHTQGPWYLTEPDRVEAKGFGMICTTRGDKFEAHANARLIAAAPDLLAVLKELKYRLVKDSFWGNLGEVEIDINIAIAKAEQVQS